MLGVLFALFYTCSSKWLKSAFDLHRPLKIGLVASAVFSLFTHPILTFFCSTKTECNRIHPFLTVLPVKARAHFFKHWIWSVAGWPDWANFRPSGDCLLWAVLEKLQIPHEWATLFHTKGYALILAQIEWATFWAIFSQTHLVTLALSPS
jgi:hypothetical protein